MIETHALEKYQMTKTETKGIDKFLAEQKEKRRLKEANNNQRLMIIYSALSEIKAERKYISGFGAARLSKKEAIDVVDSAVRPNDIF
eukprot:3923585-Heterocapsa_arctica.AAC.1